jgi:hypothetical protein
LKILIIIKIHLLYQFHTTFNVMSYPFLLTSFHTPNSPNSSNYYLRNHYFSISNPDSKKTQVTTDPFELKLPSLSRLKDTLHSIFYWKASNWKNHGPNNKWNRSMTLKKSRENLFRLEFQQSDQVREILNRLSKHLFYAKNLMYEVSNRYYDVWNIRIKHLISHVQYLWQKRK